MRFAERLHAAIISKGTPLCVGIDPARERMAPVLLAASGDDPYTMLTLFGRTVLDAVAPLVPIIKPQIAYFERYGLEGLRALETVLQYARDKGLLIVLDAKRGDIGETSAAYAKAYLAADGPYGPLVDCLTVNPYMGPDAIEPFADAALKSGKGLFVLVRTSNPGAAHLQNLIADGKPIYAHVAAMVDGFAQRQSGLAGYSDIGAVVGATLGSEARELRALLPRSIFLVPGVGAQGGSMDIVRDCFDANGMGAIVSSSRAITYPRGNHATLDELSEAIRQAALNTIKEIKI